VKYQRDIIMSWLYLCIAGIFETVWVVAIKHCDGLKPTLPLFIVIAAMAFSVLFLGMAIKTVPLNVAYAVWTGLGIVGVFLYGALALKETVSGLDMVFAGMIIIGILGLKLSGK
jgi:quaternary ammonium compound-resistance protein SugE